MEVHMGAIGTTKDTDSKGTNRFGMTFLALFGLGLLGVLSLIPSVVNQLDILPPELADLSAPVAVLISLANSMVLLAISVAVGTLLAHRVGLRSLVAEYVRSRRAVWPQLRPYMLKAGALGLLYSVILLVLDHLIDPFAGTELAVRTLSVSDIVIQLVAGVFYGGILEEIMLRWGFMTLLVWLGWRFIQRREGLPKPFLVWSAIIIAAVLFGIGHLPAMAALIELTPLIIFRTVLLNALGGLIFGWLFWKHNLETAMVSHAAVHVGLFVANLIMM